MSEIGVRELRANLAAVLRRVEAGEPVTVNVAGRPVARLQPVVDQAWTPVDLVLHCVFDHPADPGLRALLAELDEDLEPLR